MYRVAPGVYRGGAGSGMQETAEVNLLLNTLAIYTGLGSTPWC